MLKLPSPVWAMAYVLVALAISQQLGWPKVPGFPLPTLGLILALSAAIVKRGLQIEGGTRIICLPVPFAFRSPFVRMRRPITTFGKRVLDFGYHMHNL